MLKIGKFTVSILVLVKCLMCGISASESLYETELIFYHEEMFPKDFYWIIMQSEYEVNEIKQGTSQLLSDVSTLKKIVNKQNKDQSQDNESIVSLQPESSEDIELLINSQGDEQAFSQNITQLGQEINDLYLTLGSLNINLNRPHVIHQELYIRVPITKRVQLTKIVDKIQTQFNNSQNIKILSIQKGNINSFITTDMSLLHQQNVQQINEEQLIKSINVQAQKYCQNINMHLHSINSFHPLIDQNIYNQTSQQQEEQQSFITDQQMTYDQAYQQIANQQFYDYQNVFYQVKAICKGQNRPEKFKQNKIKNKTKKQKKHSKLASSHKMQKQIQKLNFKIKNQKLF